MANPWNLGTNFSLGDDANALPLQPSTGAVGLLSPAALAGSLGNPGKNGRPTQKIEQKTDTKKSTTNNLYKDSDLANRQYEDLLNMPGVQDQKAGIDQMQNYLDMQAQSAAGRDRTNLAPIAALADFENAKSGNKSNLAETYTPPEDVVSKLLAHQGEIQKQKDTLTKTIQEGVKNLKTGSQTDSTNQLLSVMAGFGLGGGGGALNSTRLDSLRKNTGEAFDKDPILLTTTKTLNSLERGSGQLNNVDPTTGKLVPVTGQVINDILQDYQGALNGGGRGTEGSMDRGLIETFKSKLNQAMTKVGQFGDLRTEDPALVKQIQGMINVIHEDVAQAGRRRAGEKLLNTSFVEDQGVRDTAKSKHDALINGIFKGAEKKSDNTSNSSENKKKAIMSATNMAELKAAQEMKE